jgi:hypothetical protein
VLWYKTWLDTRWRFLLGLAFASLAACGVVAFFDEARQLLQTRTMDLSSDNPLEQALREQLEAVQTFRGYVWFQWFDQNFSFLASVFAALLGSGAPLSTSGRGLLFSLALPVSRARWMTTRLSLGLAELFALCLLPALVIVLVAPLFGERFPLVDAIVYSICAFVASSVLFGVASLLSTAFNDAWRPLLFTLLLGLAVGLARLGFFDVMSAAGYFTGESFPWLGLGVCVALTAGLLYTAVVNVERRDF